MATSAIRTATIHVAHPTIRVTYPSIMKMEMSSEHPMKGRSVQEIKREIFRTVWAQLGEIYPLITQHGTPEDVVLKADDTVILTDEDLEEGAEAGRIFTAVFGRGGQGPSDAKN